MTEPILVSKREFARRAGVKPPSISQAIRGKLLKEALVGKKININHPDAVAYLAKKKRGVPNPAGALGMGKAPEAQAARDSLEKTDIKKILDLSLREILRTFGTKQQFRDWVDLIKSLEIIHEKRLKNAKAEGELVSRDLIKKGVIDPLDNMHKRLLADGARTIARQVHNMSLAGRAVEDCEKYVGERLTSFIQSAKVQAKKNLREAGRK